MSSGINRRGFLGYLGMVPLIPFMMTSGYMQVDVPLDVSVGHVSGPTREFVDGHFKVEVNDIVVYANGSPVELGDLVSVSLDGEVESIVRFKGDAHSVGRIVTKKWDSISGKKFASVRMV